MTHLERARRKLLVEIVKTLTVGACVPLAVSACTPSNTTATPPTDSPSGSPAKAECPDAKGTYAEWPDGKRPDLYGSESEVCLPVPPGGAKACDKAYSDACIMSRFVCGKSTSATSVEGRLPSSNPEVCCWRVKGHCAVGRPFVIDGEAVLAEARPGDDWTDRALAKSTHTLADAIAALDDATREAIADVWTRDGLTEHASVASFAQVVLELLALGAPSDLVRDAQRAMGDEIRHAERAFAIAGRYAGRAVMPGPLPIAGALGKPPTLADFAARAASEGCVAETIAALQLHAAADVARDPALAAILRTTADEESEHALLGWRIVRWALNVGGESVRSAVLAVLDDAESHVGFGPCPSDAISLSSLRAHGVLPTADRHVLAVHALTSVIAPAKATLVDGDVSRTATRSHAEA